jgi:hypothetical protein
MNAALTSFLTPAEQTEALASLSLDRVLAARGVTTFDFRKYLSVSRAEIVSFFRVHPRKAEALLLKKEEKKPVHDVLCLEGREESFVIYDMDHGNERSHYWYDSLPEAAADFVAFRIGYGYPDGYGFKKEG